MILYEYDKISIKKLGKIMKYILEFIRYYGYFKYQFKLLIFFPVLKPQKGAFYASGGF